MQIRTLFAFTILLVAGCGRPTTLVFIIPNGFHGVVKLQLDKAAGVDLVSLQNAIPLIFPDSGILKVRGSLPTRSWHVWRACYANGEPINIAENASSAPSDVELRPVGDNGLNETWFVVGTFDELKVAREKQDGFRYSGP